MALKPCKTNSYKLLTGPTKSITLDSKTRKDQQHTNKILANHKKLNMRNTNPT